MAALPDPPAGRTWLAWVSGLFGQAGRHGLRVGQDGQEVVPEADGSFIRCILTIYSANGAQEGRARRAWPICCHTARKAASSEHHAGPSQVL